MKKRCTFAAKFHSYELHFSHRFNDFHRVVTFALPKEAKKVRTHPSTPTGSAPQKTPARPRVFTFENAGF